MEQIEIILRTTDPAGKVTEQILAKFDTEKPGSAIIGTHGEIFLQCSCSDCDLYLPATNRENIAIPALIHFVLP